MNSMSDLFHEKVLAERVSAATLSKMIRQKETFLPALCTHIATRTRQCKVRMEPFGQERAFGMACSLLAKRSGHVVRQCTRGGLCCASRGKHGVHVH